MADRRWWQVSWRRVVVGIVFVWISLLLLGYFAMHVMNWYMAKSIASDNPRIKLQLHNLLDTEVADLKDGMTIHRFGYSLQVPWTATMVDKGYKTIAMLSFSDGSSLLIFDPQNQVDFLTPGLADSNGRNALRQILGDEAMNSHYGLARAILNANSKEISFFHSRRANARPMMLLAMKGLNIPEQATAIYSVSSAHLRGFQFGEPQKVPTFIELTLFDEQDRDLKLVFKGPRNSTKPVLTQEQINAVVASVRRAN